MSDKLNRPLSAEVARNANRPLDENNWLDELAEQADRQAATTRTEITFDSDPLAEPLANWEAELLGHKPDTSKDAVGYVCGPMRGHPNFNYPAFNAVAKFLRKRGWVINNPAENFGGDSSHEFHEYMELDLRMVIDSKAIILMPGWEKSEGSKVEIAMAKALKLNFYLATLISPELNPYDSESWVVKPADPPAEVDGGIEAEARKLVWGDRNAAYGPPAHDFECTGRKWAATLSAHLGKHFDDIPPEIVSVMMMDLKTSRLASNTTHHDSMVDIIGYDLCHWRIVTDDGRK